MDAKRAFDLAVGSVALVAALPVLAAVRVAMRLSGDRGPFLYRAPRVGRGGVPLTILKVRTMDDGAGGSRITVADDPRVTPIGRSLRRLRIDELPQLVNVVRGEMSLVGPRPEDPRFVDPSEPLQRLVTSVRPGVTGPSQLAFIDEATRLACPNPERRYREEIRPAKLAIDAWYVRHRSFLVDMLILARTVRAIVGAT